MNAIYNFFRFFIFLFFIGCGSENHEPDNDINNIKIGNQIWQSNNLNITKFRNGDLILEVKSDSAWQLAGLNMQPAWCYINNDSKLGNQFGKLYNWWAVIDPRGLAPLGWHIPSNDEWLELIDYLGGDEKAGESLKSKTGWKSNENGNNATGFNALPGGCRLDFGKFTKFGEEAYYWTNTEYSGANHGKNQVVNGEVHWVTQGIFHKGGGLSIRCVKD